MEWWNEEITSEQATEFLEECQEFTRKVLMKQHPDLKNAKFNHVLPSTIHPFVPRGAVIHSTNTEKVWDALRVVASGAYGTHFIISSYGGVGKGSKKQDYKYLADLPCNILMPMGFESAVPHSGLMSTMTWGIDVRNIGRLRPWFSPIDTKPNPVFDGEENESIFKYHMPGIEPSYFWFKDMWREKFEGNVKPWGKFFYEIPSFAQIKTLIILLRVLNAFSPLDRKMVIPSNCIHGGRIPVMPHVYWNRVRKYSFDLTSREPTEENFEFSLPVTGYKQDWLDPERTDDAFVNGMAKYHSWRGEQDDGMRDFIFNGPMLPEIFHRRYLNYYRKVYADYGYEPDDISFSSRMYAAANGIHPDRLPDVPKAADRNRKSFKGE